ncbi:MAG: hypothetical protein WBN65_03360 [Gammaproteobacteria bacterium]
MNSKGIDAEPAPLDLPEQADLAPVYAEFGAAVHDTQVLEFGLVLLMALATRYDDAQFGTDSVMALSTAQAGQTVGELFRAVRKKEHFTSPERKAIHKAIRLRNDLVHRFMVDKVEDLFTPEGRESLLQEIRAIRDAVQSADRINASLIDHYLQEYGTSVDELKDYAAELFPSEEEETTG